MGISRLQGVCLISVAVLTATPAAADIDLRVQSRPSTDPIEAFVRVTDGSVSVQGLTAADFAVTLDGTPLDTFTLALPPDQDPVQHVSVVFVIAHSLVWGGWVTPIRAAVTTFINQMSIGDHAAVVRVRPEIDSSMSSLVVEPFHAIDGGAGTGALTNFVNYLYRSTSRSSVVDLFGALTLALDQFDGEAATLPDGPKAIVLVGTGETFGSRVTQSEVMAHADASGIPIISINLSAIDAYASDKARAARAAALAADSGGAYFAVSDAMNIGVAYRTTASLLESAYRLSIPATAVADCNRHVLQVTSRGQTASLPFTRCDSTPDDFHFAERYDAAPGALAESDPVKIGGIESPVSISVIDGEYSIGCGTTFTSDPGFILPDQDVCVRHVHSVQPATSTATQLVVGGVPGEFWSLPDSAPPPPPPPPPAPAPGPAVGGGSGGSGGGGGGAVGLIELVLAAGAVLARRRRPLQVSRQ